MGELTFTLPEIAHEFDVQYRTLFSWVECGLIGPSGWPSDGAGHASVFTEEDVESIGRLVRLRRLGLSMDGLRRAVADPQGLADELAAVFAEARPSAAEPTNTGCRTCGARRPKPGGDVCERCERRTRTAETRPDTAGPVPNNPGPQADYPKAGRVAGEEGGA